MDEFDYWKHLELRLCREFDGIDGFRQLRLWCDGFIPERHALDADPPVIRGTAWICQGEQQQKWRFTLLLGHPPADRLDINWAALLPPENVTRWIALDFENRYIEIDPGAAVPDAP